MVLGRFFYLQVTGARPVQVVDAVRCCQLDSLLRMPDLIFRCLKPTTFVIVTVVC